MQFPPLFPHKISSLLADDFNGEICSTNLSPSPFLSIYQNILFLLVYLWRTALHAQHKLIP
jgi:hypothetical protein